MVESNFLQNDMKKNFQSEQTAKFRLIMNHRSDKSFQMFLFFPPFF